MMRFALGVASVAVALAATVVPTPATTLVRRLPLEQVAAEAARVVHATVIDVRSGGGLSTLAAIRLRAGGVPARAAGPLLVNGNGDPLVWGVNPIPFNPDRGTLGTLDNAAAVQAVLDDFGVWAAVPTANISFTNAGALPVDVTVANYLSYLGVCGDGLSPIIFDTDGSITDDAFGPGASNDILGFASPECGSFVPPQIAEGVAVLNGKWIDGVDSPSNPEIPLADFKGVFVHEFGHS